MTFHNERRQYGKDRINAGELSETPILLFKKWLDEAVAAKLTDATSMHLATVDASGAPDSRVVLLKEITNKGLVFFTDYDSVKGQQLVENNQVALSIYWSQFSKQVRIRGVAEKTSREKNCEYFDKRPEASRIAAIVSNQSEAITSLDVIEEKVAKFNNTPIVCPDNWGGYEVLIKELEFFLGRDNRINERILYTLNKEVWSKAYLSP